MFYYIVKFENESSEDKLSGVKHKFALVESIVKVFYIAKGLI